MSSKLKLIKSCILFSFSIMALLGIGLFHPRATEDFQKSLVQYQSGREDISSSQDRLPAAIPTSKTTPHNYFPALEKLHPLVQVKINEQTIIPESGDQEVLLEAWVKVNGDLKGETVHFEWNLDPGVHAIEGVINGEIENMANGEWKYLPLRVYGFSKESPKLALMKATVYFEGDQIGQSAQYNSRPEDSFEYIAPILQEQANKLNIATTQKQPSSPRLHR